MSTDELKKVLAGSLLLMKDRTWKLVPHSRAVVIKPDQSWRVTTRDSVGGIGEERSAEWIDAEVHAIAVGVLSHGMKRGANSDLRAHGFAARLDLELLAPEAADKLTKLKLQVQGGVERYRR